MAGEAVNLEVEAGMAEPLGATLTEGGVNFAVYSKNATRMELCLFDETGIRETALPIQAKTGNVWHIFVKGIKAGQLYGYRVYGPYEPYVGKKFNPNKLLLDPYAKSIKGDCVWHNDMHTYNTKEPVSLLSFSSSDSAPFMPKAEVVDGAFDWGNDRKPYIPFADTVIYELNVKAITALCPDVPLAYRGKFLGLSSPAMIKYFKDLGVTSLELMPSQNFFTNSILLSKNLANLWGYDPLCFFAPHNAYLASGDIGEFKRMVKELHEEGLEVILDVVFNHSTEGNAYGPTLGYKGLDNETYYKPDPQNPMNYIDDTGCGASFNLNDDAVVKLVMDALSYWADEMHVDGFRFDLATELCRGERYVTKDAKFLKAIAENKSLQKLKLIAEPWDLGPDGYRLGWFPSQFAEWNDRYRDAVRKFWRGDKGMIVEFARRISGSQDIFKNKPRYCSINFVTAHDGFCLYDLVSYEHKRNLANGENNHDGANNNWSWNTGVEGETDNEAIRSLRKQRMRSLMATLMLSGGTPMILYGDEMARTKNGNNNTYCQDNELSWLSWNRDEKAQDFWKFMSALIHFRKENNIFDKGEFKAFRPDAKELSFENWSEDFSRSISCSIMGENAALFVIFNAYDAEIEWKLPVLPDAKGRWKTWRLVFDTAKNKDGGFGGDVYEKYTAPAWSVVCFNALN